MLCNELAQETIEMGNVVYGQQGGIVYANSPDSGPIRLLNTATISAPSRPENFHDELARNTLDAAIMGGGNIVADAAFSLAGKALSRLQEWGTTGQSIGHWTGRAGAYVDEVVAEALRGDWGNSGKIISIEKETFLQSAEASFKGQPLTNAGRATTKHPEYFGFSSTEELRTVYRTDAQLNELASKNLNEILANGTRTSGAGGRYPDGWVTYTLSDGRAASWSASGEFIGFRGLQK